MNNLKIQIERILEGLLRDHRRSFHINGPSLDGLLEFRKELFVQSKTTNRNDELITFLEVGTKFSIDSETIFELNPLRSNIFNSSNTHYITKELNQKFKFKTIQQYLNFHKALILGDINLIRKVIDQFELTEIEKAFDNKSRELWNAFHRTFLEQAISANTSQNLKLKDELLKTKDTFIIYMNPKDLTYGKYLIEKPSNYHILKSEWPGQNMLGIALTVERHKLERLNKIQGNTEQNNR